MRKPLAQSGSLLGLLAVLLVAGLMMTQAEAITYLDQGEMASLRGSQLCEGRCRSVGYCPPDAEKPCPLCWSPDGGCWAWEKVRDYQKAYDPFEGEHSIIFESKWRCQDCGCWELWVETLFGWTCFCVEDPYPCTASYHWWSCQQTD